MNDNELAEQLGLNALNLAPRWRMAGRWQDTLTLLYGVAAVANELNDVRRAQVWLHISRTLNEQATFGVQENADAHQQALDNALKFGANSIERIGRNKARDLIEAELSKLDGG